MQTARDFARKEIIPVAGHLDEEGEFPHRSLKQAWETGLMNFEVPEEYGGLGLSCLDHCLILEEIACGCAGRQHHPGGQHARRDAAARSPAPRSRRRSTSAALTSGRDGSRSSPPTAAPSPTPARDVAGMKTPRHASDGDDYVLNGQKRWITNGGVRQLLHRLRDASTGRRTPQGHHLLRRRPPTRRASRSGKKENKMGQRASNTTDVIFEDVKLTEEARWSAPRARASRSR